MFRKAGLAVFPHQKGYVYCQEKLIRQAAKRLEARDVEGFSELARTVIQQNKTTLGYDRLYVLYQAMWNVRHLAGEAASIAEVGVFRGGGTYFLAASADRLFETKPRIHAFDTFEGHHSEDLSPEVDGPHRSGKFSDTSFAEVQHYLSAFNNVILYQGRFQDRCNEIQGETFCLAHIDVDIYTVTKDCLNFFADRVLIGGIMIVDDYGYKTCEGAKLAVDEFISESRNFIKFHLETSQCILVRMS
jgi:hypothetical protein